MDWTKDLGHIGVLDLGERLLAITLPLRYSPWCPRCTSQCSLSFFAILFMRFPFTTGYSLLLVKINSDQGTVCTLWLCIVSELCAASSALKEEQKRGGEFACPITIYPSIQGDANCTHVSMIDRALVKIWEATVLGLVPETKLSFLIKYCFSSCSQLIATTANLTAGKFFPMLAFWDVSGVMCVGCRSHESFFHWDCSGHAHGRGEVCCVLLHSPPLLTYLTLS